MHQNNGTMAVPLKTLDPNLADRTYMDRKKSEKITATFVAKTKEPGEYFDTEIKGFSLRVMPSGVKSYVLRGRVKGQTNKLTYTIGKHGDITTDRARAMAADLKHNLRKGIDPRDTVKENQEKAEAVQAEKQKQERAQELTLRFVFEHFVENRNEDKRENKKATKGSTKTLYRNVLFKHLSDWLDLPMVAISEEMIRERYKKVKLDSKSSASNAFRALRRLYNWGIGQFPEVITSNPVTVITKAEDLGWVKIKPREEQITDKDLHKWFRAVNNLKNRTARDYYILLIFTGLRKNEAAKLQWTDVDFNAKYFTARNTKNGSDHFVALTSVTYNLLRERSKITKGDGYVFPSHAGGHVSDLRFHQDLVTRESGVKFSPQVLRATFSQAVARCGVTEVERKALLNHKPGNVTDEFYTIYERIQKDGVAIRKVEVDLKKLLESPPVELESQDWEEDGWLKKFQ